MREILDDILSIVKKEVRYQRDRQFWSRAHAFARAEILLAWLRDNPSLLPSDVAARIKNTEVQNPSPPQPSPAAISDNRERSKDCQIRQEDAEKSTASFQLDDLSDLPPDFAEKILSQKGDKLEREIIDIVKKAGHPLRVDEVWVAYFRIHGIELDRDALASKLYRMTGKKRKKLAVPSGKRGIYGLPEWK